MDDKLEHQSSGACTTATVRSGHSYLCEYHTKLHFLRAGLKTDMNSFLLLCTCHTAEHFPLCCKYSSAWCVCTPTPAAHTAVGKVASCISVYNLLQGWSLVCTCKAAALHHSRLPFGKHVTEVTTQALHMVHSKQADLRLMLAGPRSVWVYTTTKQIKLAVQSSLLGMLHTVK